MKCAKCEKDSRPGMTCCAVRKIEEAAKWT